MSNRITVICAVTLACLLGAAGCQKKVTKVEEPVKPKEQPAPKVEEAPRPVQLSDSFNVVDLDAKMKEILVPVYFNYDKYDLLPESVSKLEKIAPFLQSNAAIRVLIEGNADERGSAEYNVGLGESRARSVKNYLTTYGIPDTRMEITSYGKERPAFPNCGADESCHAKNRRVEWKILAK
jgi:peptidoglycan-associated lipoprotein